MSIHRMIALHPAVGEDFNAALATVARHAMFCAEMRASCADACLAEPMDMTQCVRSCLDCSDVCTATAQLAVRRTGRNVEAMLALLDTCARVCELCAAECARHDQGHCQLCAEMCRECMADCRAAMPTVN